MVKNLPAMQADLGSMRGSRKSPGEGNGNPLQYSCLEKPMDRGTWREPWGRKESDTIEQLTCTQIDYPSSGKLEKEK